MFDTTPLLRFYARRRLRALGALDPVETQRSTLLCLVRQARSTLFGRAHGFDDIGSVEAFQARVPLRRYEDFWRDYWKSAFPVLDDVTWPRRVPFFAVTSGTTSGTTKYIPVTRAMRRSNIKASLDVLVHHLQAKPQSRVFGGKSFMLGGSTALVEQAPGVFSGDLSGIAAKTLPDWAARLAFPDAKTALIEDWEQKVELLARGSLEEDIRVLTGTPSWILILLARIEALRGGQRPLLPYLELFVHGGVNFAPYRQRFLDLFAGEGVDMREVYPASEGFIASADRRYGEGLRLNIDHGLFFEFVPVAELDNATPTRHWLASIETGVNYAVVMSTCAGLWSYVLGDTVRFVDTQPPRLVITGRTSYGLSAFGEHLIAEEIETAVATAASAISKSVTDYSVGAIFPGEPSAKGCHLYIVEFANGIPDRVQQAAFTQVIDRELSRLNEDYHAHRAGGFGLEPPRLKSVPPGTFSSWMKARGKLGGQHKVPRIINDQSLWNNLLVHIEARLSAI